MTLPVAVTVARDLSAPAERVFDAWLAARDVSRFFIAAPDGEMIRCEIDARIGGEGYLVERRTSGDVGHRLRFEQIDQPRHLAFLFTGDRVSEVPWTRVTVAIEPKASGCTLTLTHTMGSDRVAHEAQVRRSWAMVLDRLAKLVEDNG